MHFLQAQPPSEINIFTNSSKKLFITLSFLYLQISNTFWNCEYRKIPKISPGAYIFQRPFLRGLFLEGLIFKGAYLRREICVSKSIGLALQLEVNLPFLLCCCGATEGSEQQHNQDLKEIYKKRRILEFITFYHNTLHLTTLFTTMHCI